MKIARLILLGALASVMSFSAAEAATFAPKLDAPGAATLADTDTSKDKKAKKPKVAHKVKKVKKDKKDT